ncbi:MAG TPA: aminoglycoside phosphotransferase APH(3') [Micromonosporaceae bacterium]|nr:aminoglycoside phosphotransferase APH(3') [Micromonosporaceae bacterium]
MRPLPFDLTDRFAAWRWRVAWSFDPDAPTYVFTNGDERRFVKLAASGRAIPDEAQKLRWALGYLPVPEVIEYGSDGETDWLMTAALEGVDATQHPWLTEDPHRLVVALGEGLKVLHSGVPVNDCPFDFSPPTAVAHVKARLAAGLVSPEPVERLIATAPQDWAEVVCHGDYCLPNALLTDGKVTGYLDLGRLAVADPWWDLAIGALSCTWNLGPGYEELFYSAYGVSPDPERIAWYRLLYDLV